MTLFRNRNAMVEQLIKPHSIGAEIGVWQGHFSRDLCRLANVRKLYLIDAWEKFPGYSDDPKNEEDHNENLRLTKAKVRDDYLSGRVGIIRGYSVHAAANFPDDKFDFIYLDACHNYEAVRDDLRAWAPKLKPNGLLMGHDYVEHTEIAKRLNFGVIKAVNEFCASNNWTITHLTQEEDFPSYCLQRL